MTQTFKQTQQKRREENQARWAELARAQLKSEIRLMHNTICQNCGAEMPKTNLSQIRLYCSKLCRAQRVGMN